MDKWSAMANKLLQPNSHAIGVLKILDQYYPAFAKKVLYRNPVVEKAVMSRMIDFDILKYPICNHCETLALWNRYYQNPDGSNVFKADGTKVAVARCWKCGKDSINPVTFREWCLMELKKRAPENIGDSLDFAVDAIAERCMADAERLYQKAQKEATDVQSE